MNNYELKESTGYNFGQTERFGVLKLAQDVHAHGIVVSLQEEGQQPKPPRKFEPEAYLKQVAKWVGQSRKVYSCYEAGPTGFALHRRLTALGVENVVIVPSRLDEQGKRVKNDKTDTLQLACRLDRYTAGNKRIFSVVRVPSLEEEQRRAWTRQRKQLQRQRLSLASMGRSLVLTQGRAISNLWWKPTHWKRHQEQLKPELVEQLELFRSVILAINEQLEKVEQKILARRKESKEARPRYAGDLTLEIIEAEVCNWHRLTSWRKVGSYSGLTGGVSASGNSHRDLSITKVGNKRLRTALIEMAWRFVRHQPDYWLTRKWAPVLHPQARAHRRVRKKAIVAYARQLFVDLWRWKTGRKTPEQLGWQMVSREP